MAIAYTVSNTVNTVFNAIKNDFPEVLAEAELKGMHDFVQNNAKLVKDQRTANVYPAYGGAMYSNDWDSAPTVQVVVDLVLRDTDTEVMPKYLDALISFLDSLEVGVKSLVVSAGASAKDGNDSPSNRVWCLYEVGFDPLTDSDDLGYADDPEA